MEDNSKLKLNEIVKHEVSVVTNNTDITNTNENNLTSPRIVGLCIINNTPAK
jgi:hypothetical protein